MKMFKPLALCAAALSLGAAHASTTPPPNYCTMHWPADIDCYIPNLPAATGRASGYWIAMNHHQVQGRTRAQVHASFAPTVLANIQYNPNPSAAISRLSNQDLAYLASLYLKEGGSQSAFLTMAAKSVTDVAQLKRVQAAFGAAATAKAIAANSSFDVQAQYFSQAEAVPLAGSPAEAASMGVMAPMAAGPSPNIDMSLYEIYLEYRTATYGALSMESAIAMTGVYSSTMLFGAYEAGYTVGTGINWFIDQVDPGATADFISEIVNAFNWATDMTAKTLGEPKTVSPIMMFGPFSAIRRTPLGFLGPNYILGWQYTIAIPTVGEPVDCTGGKCK